LEPTEKIAVAVLEKMMEREMKDLLHGLNYSVTEAPNWSKVAFNIYLRDLSVIYCRSNTCVCKD